jgi:hypothetical protein
MSSPTPENNSNAVDENSVTSPGSSQHEKTITSPLSEVQSTDTEDLQSKPDELDAKNPIILVEGAQSSSPIESDVTQNFPGNDHLSFERFEWANSYSNHDSTETRAKGPPQSNRYLCVSYIWGFAFSLFFSTTRCLALVRTKQYTVLWTPTRLAK